MWCGRYYLRRRCPLLLLFLAWVVCSTGCATPVVSPPPEDAVKEKPEIVPHVLRDIRVTDKKVHLKLIRSGLRSINYTGFKLLDPLRLVVDLSYTVSDRVPSPMAVEDEIIGKVETIEFVHESQPVTRVEISLTRDTAYFIDQGQDEIWVTFFTDPDLIETGAVQGEPVVHPELEEHPPETKVAEAASTPQPLAQEPIVPSQTVEKESLPSASKIIDIKPVAYGEEFSIQIIGDGGLDNYDVSVLRDPPRMVIDFMGVRATEVQDVLSVDGPLVKRIRVGQHPNKVRVVFDLTHVPKGGVPYKVTLEDERIVFSF